jgi:hypothetical protein
MTMDISTGEILGLASMALTVILLAVVWIRTRPANVAEAVASLQQVAEVAETAVSAAEQLWRTGKLPSDQRFGYAMTLLEAEFPAMRKEHLIAALEASVFWLKEGMAARADIG